MGFSNCINIVKITINNKKKGFIIENNNKNISIIKEFLKLNVLKFVIIKENKIICYVNYLNEKPVFSNIVNFFKPSKKRYISLKELKKITNKNNWVFILSTNKGIINSIDAIRLNTSGLILAQLWN